MPSLTLLKIGYNPAIHFPPEKTVRVNFRTGNLNRVEVLFNSQKTLEREK